MAAAQGPVLELAVLLDRADPALDEGVVAEDLALFATPAINLFEKALSRSGSTAGSATCTSWWTGCRPTDFEVHSLLEVAADGAAAPEPFLPFYALAHPEEAGAAGAYYTVERRQRLATAQEVQRAGADRRPAARTRPRHGWGNPLRICRRRALPGAGRRRRPALARRGRSPARQGALHKPRPAAVHSADAWPDAFRRRRRAAGAGRALPGRADPAAPVIDLADPAAPAGGRSPGETPWRLVSQLSLNYLSLLDSADGAGAEALRQLLRLYAAFAEPAVARQVDGLQSVASRPVVDRMPMAGPITFGRGLEIELTFEERAFDGGSAFVLGGVLEAFFRRYVALNSFDPHRGAHGRAGRDHAMAGTDRSASPDLSTELRDEARRFDFFAALRLLECARPDAPRLGKAARAREEPLRLGQEPQLPSPPRSLAGFAPGSRRARRTGSPCCCSACSAAAARCRCT